MTQTDTLDRRLRHAKPQPRKQNFEISERDLLIFEELHEHGPLPSNYLYELTKRLGKNRGYLQHRLTSLYNGATSGPGFLTRPEQQWRSLNAKYQPVIYDIGPRAHTTLAEHTRLANIERTDPFLHRFMSACISASLQLACEEKGLRYITKSEIFTHSKCPEATRKADNPLAIPLSAKKSIIPDDLFGIEYPDGKLRFFVVEIDRNTESIKRNRIDQTAYGQKLQTYLSLMRQDRLAEHWGLPRLMVMTVTTNLTHEQNMMEYLKGISEAKYANRFIFTARQEFGVNWRVPEVMRDLLTEPWQQVSGTPFSINKS